MQAAPVEQDSGIALFTKSHDFKAIIHCGTTFRCYVDVEQPCDIAIYADDTNLYSKCDRASDLWQQLDLATELESDL